MSKVGCLLLAAVAAGRLAAASETLAPSGTNDMTAAVTAAVRRLSAAGGGTLGLADGAYHFHSSAATQLHFHVSNHDQPKSRPVFLPLAGITNVTLSAKNAKFVMHGMGTALLLGETQGVKISGVTIEWERPFFAQAEILGFADGLTKVRFLARDRVVLDGGRLVLCGEDWRSPLTFGNVFDGKTHEIVEGTGDVAFSGRAVAGLAAGEFSLDIDLSRVGVGAKAGDVYVLRNGYRPHPVVCLDRARDTVFEDFVFRDGFGMGILVQLSENFTLRGGGTFPRHRGEYCANVIDATHFSNCRGTVTVEDCRFEGMMDDALNVHSTCLKIVAKPQADTIRCRFMHHQAVGLDLFAPGDAVRFIAARTLENGFVGRVCEVRRHDEREITLRFEDAIPAAYGVGDAVESAEWQCAVNFRRNTVANNRARGVLFTTPKPVVCESNRFERVSGAAILLAGDAQGWYESGACESVTIRGNRFVDCLTSAYQYCDAVVSIHPEVRDLATQRDRYHRNIVVEDNEFDTFEVPLLFAKSVRGLKWRNNAVRYLGRHRPHPGEPFQTIGCEDVEIDR